MKRFVAWFLVNYLIMVILYLYLFLLVPDQFPGQPPPKGVDSLFVLTEPVVGAILMCTTFPSIFLTDFLSQRIHVLPLAAALLLSLTVSAALWAWLFVKIGERQKSLV